MFVSDLFDFGIQLSVMNNGFKIFVYCLTYARLRFTDSASGRFINTDCHENNYYN